MVSQLGFIHLIEKFVVVLGFDADITAAGSAADAMARLAAG